MKDEGEEDDVEDASESLEYNPADETLTRDDFQYFLVRAAQEGNESRVVSLLRDKQADVNACCPPSVNPMEWNALHFAAANGRASMVKLLLSHGASVGARNRMGYTPLHCAALGNPGGGGTLECCKILVNGGGDLGAKDENGRIPVDRSVK